MKREGHALDFGEVEATSGAVSAHQHPRAARHRLRLRLHLVWRRLLRGLLHLLRHWVLVGGRRRSRVRAAQAHAPHALSVCTPTAQRGAESGVALGAWCDAAAAAAKAHRLMK